MFRNGNTAIEGLSGRVSAGPVFGRYDFGRVLSGGEPYSVDPHRSGNVFEALLAQILERKAELTRYVLLHASRHTDAARIGQAFQAGRDVHAVTENVAVFDDNIANIDAYSKFDASVGGGLGITLSHNVLNLSRTPYGIDHTGELGQQTVPGGFDDAPSMFGDLRVDHVRPDRLSLLSVPSSSAPISRE
jgi:hypothetical protein